jgi:hypothetical protein
MHFRIGRMSNRLTLQQDAEVYMVTAAARKIIS